MTQEQKSFIQKVGTLAQTYGNPGKILPSLTIAQAILESGWGTSGLSRNANALFGIKAGSDWTGKVYSCRTEECYDGVHFTTETGCFRAYDSWGESIADHAAFLCGLQRYHAVVGETDYRTACRAVHTAGYATDPGYADKLISIIASFGLTTFDTAAKMPEPSGLTGQCYLVEWGDTLTKIAARFGVTIEDILAENRVKYPNMTRDYIQAGWVLAV